MRKKLLAVLLASMFAGNAWAENKNINIAPQDMPAALHSLASQTGIQLLFTADDLKGIQTRAVSGSMSIEDALGRLLEGTDYIFAVSGSGTYVLRRKDVQRVSTLDEVVVTARMPLLPLDARKSSLDNIERQQSADTAHLLDGQPGVDLWTAGGVSGLPALHGLQDDRVRILVDDTTITSACSNHMNPALSYISPSQIEQITVFAGITPVSMGGDSIGGTILVESAKPDFANGSDTLLKSGTLGMRFHDNRGGVSAFAKATLASASNNLTYDAALARANSYARGNGGPVVPATLYKTFNQSLAFAHQMTEGGVLKADVALQHTPYEGFPNQSMDLTGNNARRFGLGLEDHYGWGTLSAKLYYHNTDHKMDVLPLPERGGNSMLMLTQGTDKGYLVKAEIPLAERSTLRLGNEFHQQQLNDWWPIDPALAADPVYVPFIVGDFININNGTRNRIGTYGEIQTQWDRRWSTLLGIRNDQVRMNTGNVHGYFTTQDATANAFNALDRSRKDNNFDLTALARLSAGENSDYEFGFARKTRSPSLYERYMWFMTNMNNLGMGDLNNYQGNPDLKPEVAHHLGFTADWHDAQKEQWQIRIAPYYTKVKDYIWAQQTGSFLPFGRPWAMLKYTNLNQATLYGIDLSGRSALGSGFALRGQLSYVRGQNDDTGENLYHMMPLNARAGVDYTTGSWNGSFDVIGVKAKTQVSENYYEPKTAGYMIANLRGGYRITKDTQVDIGCDNLFDKLYYYPSGGINKIETDAAGYPQTLADRRLVAAPGRTCSAGFVMKF